MVSRLSWVSHHGESRLVPSQAKGAIVPRLWLGERQIRQG
jgi:hypothetical protein